MLKPAEVEFAPLAPPDVDPERVALFVRHHKDAEDRVMPPECYLLFLTARGRSLRRTRLAQKIRSGNPAIGGRCWGTKTGSSRKPECATLRRRA